MFILAIYEYMCAVGERLEEFGLSDRFGLIYYRFGLSCDRSR